MRRENSLPLLIWIRSRGYTILGEWRNRCCVLCGTIRHDQGWEARYAYLKYYRSAVYLKCMICQNHVSSPLLWKWSRNSDRVQTARVAARVRIQDSITNPHISHCTRPLKSNSRPNQRFVSLQYLGGRMLTKIKTKCSFKLYIYLSIYVHTHTYNCVYTHTRIIPLLICYLRLSDSHFPQFSRNCDTKWYKNENLTQWQEIIHALSLRIRRDKWAGTRRDPESSLWVSLMRRSGHLGEKLGCHLREWQQLLQTRPQRHEDRVLGLHQLSLLDSGASVGSPPISGILWSVCARKLLWIVGNDEIQCQVFELIQLRYP